MNALPPTSPRLCAVCQSAEKALLFRQQFLGADKGSLLAGYDVVVCQWCGFCFADQIPEQTDFDRYYRELSKYERQEAGGQESEFHAWRYPASARMIAPWLPARETHILDIGCANGGLLNALRDIGFQHVMGVDPSPVCAQTALQRYGIRVAAGTLSQMPPDLGLFDLVILSAVLEHIRDIEMAFARVRERLRPDGLLYIELPDATRFATAPDAPYQEFSTEHINYFSPPSLTNLLRGQGFDAVFCERNACEQSPGAMIHEIRGMFRRRSEKTSEPLLRERETQAGLLAYIASSQKMESAVHRVIAPWVAGGEPLIVWGVGTHTQRLLATSPLAHGNIAAFVDSNPRYQGKLLSGVPIIAPEALKERSEPILISSRGYQQEIERQIREDLHLDNQIIKLY